MTPICFFVATNQDAGALANVHRFRFYSDARTTNLLETFRDGYFTSSDMDRIKELGYNCIRVPFLSTLVQDYTGTNYLEEGRNRLDWLISECTRHRIWCILDLHGAPGGQNRATDSGRAEGLWNRLWGGELYKNNLVHLWKTVAGWYQTNSTVAGYDVFNEPDPPGTGWKTELYTNTVLPVLEDVYSGIRSKDTNHVIFMESNFLKTNMWDAIWACPSPAGKGWTNVVYEFHHYDRTGEWTNDVSDAQFESQKGVADTIVRNYVRFSEQRQVPVFVGEFMPVEVPNFDYFIRQFEANGLSWAQWNYRHWGWDDSNRPWSSWGLDYRADGQYGGINTNIQPDVMADSFETLSDKLAGYTRANYLTNEHLCEVVANSTLNTNSARERTEFYVNTFSARDCFDLWDPDAWSWWKVTGIGDHAAFQIFNGRAKARVFLGPLGMRFASRPEADARFDINDSTGCWFSFEPWEVCVTQEGANAEAEFRLCVVRDEITERAYDSATVGIIARMLYEQSNSVGSVSLCVSRKDGGAGTYETNLYQSGAMSFVPGQPLQLFVNSNTASLLYGTETEWSGPHGMNVDSWLNGAVCIAEAEQPNATGTWYVVLDDLRAWRPDAQVDGAFTEDFSTYPSGMAIRAEPECGNVRRWTNEYAESYVTNGTLFWIPQRISEGGSWYNPKREYQKDVRLNLTSTNVIEFQVALSNFSDGIVRICLMPEYFPGEIYKQYVGTALYLQITNRADGHIVFDLYRHEGPSGDRVPQGGNRQFVYAGGTNITWQVSTNVCRLWYGTSEVLNEDDGDAVNWVHDVTNAVLSYADGVYPHIEFLNDTAESNATLRVDRLSVMQRSDFVAP